MQLHHSIVYDYLFNFLKWKEFETPEVIRVDTGVLGLCKYMHWTISKH